MSSNDDPRIRHYALGTVNEMNEKSAMLKIPNLCGFTGMTELIEATERLRLVTCEKCLNHPNFGLYELADTELE